MSRIYPFTETLLTMTVTDLIKLKPTPGHNKTSTERYAHGHDQQVRGMSEVLANYGTHLRCLEIGSLLTNAPAEVQQRNQYVPGVEAHVIHRWVKTLVERWDRGDFTKLSDEEFFHTVTDEFDSFVHDDTFTDLYWELRKQLIRAGIHEPAPSDRGWIEEELSAMLQVADPLAKLKEKLEAVAPGSEEKPPTIGYLVKGGRTEV